MRKKKMTFAEGIRAQFSTKSLVLIPIAVGINLIGGTLCSALKLPLFLDMIGTIVVACLSGIWVSALCGLLTNVFLALVANPVYLPYSIVSVLCAAVTGYMVKKVFQECLGSCSDMACMYADQHHFRLSDHNFRLRRVSRRDRNFSTDRNADRSYEKHYNFGIIHLHA